MKYTGILENESFLTDLITQASIISYLFVLLKNYFFTILKWIIGSVHNVCIVSCWTIIILYNTDPNNTKHNHYRLQQHWLALWSSGSIGSDRVIFGHLWSVQDKTYKLKTLKIKLSLVTVANIQMILELCYCLLSLS